MKNRNRILSLLLAGAMALGLTACGASNAGAAADETGSAAVSTESASSDTAASGEKIINVGVTNTIGSINPLLLNGGEINKYATGLMFLPLMELDADLNFEGMLADSITTEDNKNFIVHIDDAATWSDGTPVTADDVVYTALRLASPVIGNTAMMYYVFEGVGDDGFVEEGAESIDGIQKVDDKTVQFTTKEEMPITTFENSYARYLLTLPKHVIEQYSEEELSTADWFNHPDVVSGPFIVTDFDVDHYISYEANKDYWKGAPKIDKLNIKIVDGSQLYAGLQSGEIDITQQTMSDIPQEDYESVEALDNVDVVYGSPVTNQSVFIQTKNVPDVKVRQAMLYAIDRQQILEELLNGHGEIVDGFLSSASPFYDDSLTPVSYDPEKAKELLKEAGYANGINLGEILTYGGADSPKGKAAVVIQSNLSAVGITVGVDMREYAAAEADMYGQNYDLVIFGDSNNYDFNNIRQQVHSESKGMYLVKFKDDRSPFDWKRMEELVDLGVSTTDVKERLKYYTELWDLVMKSATILPLLHKPVGIVWTSDLDISEPVPNFYKIRQFSWK